jgi:signal transduction histidine kinase
MILHRRKYAYTGRQLLTLEDKGSRSRQSLIVPSTASGRYDNLYREKWSRHCTRDKTYGGALYSMDSVVVFHLL